MKRIFFCLIFSTLLTNSIFSSNDSSIVYFTKEITAQSLLKIYQAMGVDLSGKIGVKVHFGEEGNQNFLSAELYRQIIKAINGTFVETNVLYVSKRRYTDSHIELAKNHGFNYAPINILDALGDSIIPYQTKHFKEIKTGKDFFSFDNYLVISHFKGHGSAGFGGAIKNISMGMASIAGKMALHANDIPTTDDKKCIKCGICVKECPVNAITLNPLKIDKTKCIGCAKCIGECPTRAFGIPWASTEQNEFLEKLVEYAMVLIKQRKMIYINVLANISKSCDCSKHAPKPFVRDIGILASTDIVAIEQASHDLIDQEMACDDAFVKVGNPSGKKQIEYAFQLKMGNIKYKIVNL
jgi:uncharacterized Fe-S center protein